MPRRTTGLEKAGRGQICAVPSLLMADAPLALGRLRVGMVLCRTFCCTRQAGSSGAPAPQYACKVSSGVLQAWSGTAGPTWTTRLDAELVQRRRRDGIDDALGRVADVR
jgi:hypothetical protein